MTDAFFATRTPATMFVAFDALTFLTLVTALTSMTSVTSVIFVLFVTFVIFVPFVFNRFLVVNLFNPLSVFPRAVASVDGVVHG